MREPLFLQPAFQEKIWGGNRLHALFGFDLSSDKIGEDWAISAHPHGISTTLNDEFKGKKLDELRADHQELFDHAGNVVLPLLTKILDAEGDLFVQAHPDDTCDQKHKGGLSKTECWHITDTEPGTEVTYGHRAKTEEELAEMIEEGRWDSLLRKVPVKRGDFYYVPSGIIRAIGSDILILETQQSGDAMCRAYDCNRADDQEKTRELRIRQSISMTTVSAKDPDLSVQQESQGRSSIVTYVKTDSFNVYEWRVSGVLKVKKQAPYTLATVTRGVGRLITEDAAKADAVTFDLRRGGSFIFPTSIPNWRFKGDLMITVSEPDSR